jgi:hypothetical protein
MAIMQIFEMEAMLVSLFIASDVLYNEISVNSFLFVL